FQWVALATAYGIRSKKPFHALEVSRRRTVTLVHVTATDPFRSGRHADLVSHRVVANCCAHCMGAMTKVVAGKRRIVAAGVSDAIVNCIVPVVIVISRDSIPAAVMGLKRVVSPTLASICAADRNSLPRESQRPHVRCVGVTDVRLNGLRLLLL